MPADTRGRPSDAELVARARAGDRDAFGAIYDRYADPLFGFCAALLHSRDDAADATQDVFVLAARKLDQLRSPDRLRSWLYAIARREAMRRMSSRSRVIPSATAGEGLPVVDDSPERQVNADDAARIVWAAAEGLSAKDRILLELHLRQGLDGQELADAIGVSPSHAYVLMSRLRDQVERSLGALLVARLGRDDCEKLQTVLTDWDGTYSPLWRKRVARHVDECEVCSDNRTRLASPWRLLAAGAVPGLGAPDWLRSRVLERMGDPATPLPPGTWRRRSARGGFPPPLVRPDRRRRTIAAVSAAAILAAGAGGSVLWYTQDDDEEQSRQPVVAVPTSEGVRSIVTTTTPTLAVAPSNTTSSSPTASDTHAPSSTPSTAPPPSTTPAAPPDGSGPTANPTASLACVDFNHSPQVLAATVTDPSGVGPVVAHVTVGGSTTDHPMVPGGGSTFSVTITRAQFGAVPATTVATWTVNATDGLGNSSATAGPSFTIGVPCP